MKSLFFKIFLFLVLVVGISCAQTIKLESSWQLLGTSVPIENTHTFNRECVDSVWTYDKGVWYYYKPGNELSNLKKIDKERGFWVQAKESCTFSSSDIVAPQNLDSSLDFEILSSWSETAVRKVLNLWAYGSFASEAQIKTWASMSPSLAIKEMLTFESSNPKISPPQEDALNNYPTFAQRSIFWSGSDLSNKTLSEHKKNFEFDNWSSPKSLWISSVNKRGLNPFLHKVGFFETNYHAVANQNAGVYPQALNTYYDAIISKLSLGVPYEEVLAEAASSGAIAYQYGHNRNIFKDGKFRGNEDFAREFHQLLFGILGEYDHDYHEFTTIRNTAKALTGIVVNWHSKEEGGQMWYQIMISLFTILALLRF